MIFFKRKNSINPKTKAGIKLRTVIGIAVGIAVSTACISIAGAKVITASENVNYTEDGEGWYKDFEYEIYGNSITITDYWGDDTAITIPEKIEGLPVTNIGARAFYNQDFTMVTLPSTIKEIEVSAFQLCSSLKGINIPSNVTTIANNAFDGCKSLTSITIPAGVKSIGVEAFLDCVGLKTVTFSEGLQSIGKNAFFNCTSLMSLSFPKSLRTVGEQAFTGCNHVEKLIFKEGVTTIGDRAFAGNTVLTSITVPTSLNSLGASAFSNLRKYGHVDVVGNGDSEALINKLQTAGIDFKSGNWTYTVPEVSLNIISQPSEKLTLTEGISTTLSVKAVGKGTLKYQWYIKSAKSDYKPCSASGNNTANMTFKPSLSQSGKKIKCVVTDASGKNIETKEITLTVKPVATIISQPTDVQVREGSYATFSVSTKETGLKYQWYLRVPGGAWKKCTLSTATTSTIKFKPTMKSDNKEFICKITNADGYSITTNVVTLDVYAKIVITSQPVDAVVKAGTTARFEVAATGENLTYQWYISSDGGKTFTRSKSEIYANSPVYKIKATEARNGYVFACIIKDSYGKKLVSDKVRIIIKG